MDLTSLLLLVQCKSLAMEGRGRWMVVERCWSILISFHLSRSGETWLPSYLSHASILLIDEFENGKACLRKLFFPMSFPLSQHRFSSLFFARGNKKKRTWTKIDIPNIRFRRQRLTQSLPLFVSSQPWRRMKKDRKVASGRWIRFWWATHWVWRDISSLNQERIN